MTRILLSIALALAVCTACGNSAPSEPDTKKTAEVKKDEPKKDAPKKAEADKGKPAKEDKAKEEPAAKEVSDEELEAEYDKEAAAAITADNANAMADQLAKEIEADQ